MEWINPAEVFGRIMVEYCYPECTTAVMTALVAYRNYNPLYRRKEIDRAVLKAGKWVHSDQRDDGSWYGSWGICFTYAGMFAMECLACVGETYETSTAQFKACTFLVERQNEDGGWGESWESCELGVWTPHPDGSQVVNTAWALSGLMYAKFPNKEVLRRGIKVFSLFDDVDGSFLWDDNRRMESGCRRALREFSTRIGLSHFECLISV
jgi:lanosterol synthase